MCVAITFRCYNLILSPAAGDDSSNEDQGEEGAGGDGEMEKKIKKLAEGDDGVSEQLAAVPEEVNVEESSGEEEEMKNEESDDFSFPDTTISLSHLQPNR